MTRLHPEDRPTKEQVAADLAAWKELATAPVALDVSAARSRLRNKLSTTIAEQDAEAQQRDLAHAAVRRLQQLTAPLNAALKDLSERTEIDSATDKMTTNILKSHGYGGPQVVFRWHRCTIVSPLDRPVSTTLRMGRSLELRRDGVLLLHLMIHVGPEGVMGTDFNWVELLARIDNAWRSSTSFMRVMAASILATMSLLVVYGLAQPTVAGLIAAVVLVPLSVVTARSWFLLRPAVTGAEPEQPIRGFGMWYALVVLLVILVPTVLFIVGGTVWWLLGNR